MNTPAGPGEPRRRLRFDREPPELVRAVAALRARVQHYLDAIEDEASEADHDEVFDELETAMTALANRYGEGPRFTWAADGDPPIDGEVAMPRSTEAPLAFTFLSTAHAEAFIEGGGVDASPDDALRELLDRVLDESLDFDLSPPSVRRNRILESDRDAAFVLGLILIRGDEYEPDIGLSVTDPELHGAAALGFLLVDLLGWVRTAAAHSLAAQFERTPLGDRLPEETIERARALMARRGGPDDPERLIRVRIDAAGRLAESMQKDERLDAAGRFSPVGRLIERAMIELGYDPWTARDACGILASAFAWGALGVDPTEADIAPEQARSFRAIIREELASPDGPGVPGGRRARLLYLEPVVAAYAIGASWRLTIDRAGFSDWRAPWSD
jgi:hypothetical protein